MEMDVISETESSSGDSLPDYAVDVNVGDASTVVHTMASLYKNDRLKDVILKVNGNEYPAHRLILSANSDVFDTMLTNPQWSESKESAVTLQESPECAEVFEVFLEYFYTGFVRVNHETVLPLLTLADKYNVQSLNSLCVKFMQDQVPRAAYNNQIVSWLHFTEFRGYEDLSKAFKEFLTWNFNGFAESSCFKYLDVRVLISLLKKSDLVVESEKHLFGQVVSWLSFKEKMLQEKGDNPEVVGAQMVNIISEVMDCIRFPMMDFRDLQNLYLEPLTRKHAELFAEKIQNAVAYHEGKRDEKIQEALQTEKGRLQFTPRLYNGCEWSSVLSVYNYVSLPFYSTTKLTLTTDCAVQFWLKEHCIKWNVQLLPKGVFFDRGYVHLGYGFVEIPEYIMHTVRLAISCNDIPPGRGILMRIAVLIYGRKNNVQHICKVVQKTHCFTEDDKFICMDDLIPFDELNPSADVLPTNTSYTNPYLLGPNEDILEVGIVMVPLTAVLFK